MGWIAIAFPILTLKKTSPELLSGDVFAFLFLSNSRGCCGWSRRLAFFLNLLFLLSFFFGLWTFITHRYLLLLQLKETG